MEKEKVKEELKELDLSYHLESNDDIKLRLKRLLVHDVKFISTNDAPNYIGNEEANKYIDSFFNMEDLKLKFELLYVDVSDDFTLGYTINKMSVSFKKDGKLISNTGRYILVWKKYNGEWKISINMG
ncbi:MAG: hypothetical protein KQ78_01174 [Candidatus Izimaplasma bacterium HR2]|nr:MAG: hypothetical protein KQ78_01174 [Candidatus Izimaplasma bacterium HR2]